MISDLPIICIFFRMHYWMRFLLIIALARSSHSKGHLTLYAEGSPLSEVGAKPDEHPTEDPPQAVPISTDHGQHEEPLLHPREPDQIHNSTAGLHSQIDMSHTPPLKR